MLLEKSISKQKVSSNLLSLHERKIDEFDKEIEEEANSNLS
jgi:hypothetical protein